MCKGQGSMGTKAATTMAESFEDKPIDQVSNYLETTTLKGDPSPKETKLV